MDKVTIVLMDWMGYSLYRRKSIGDRYVHCGLGNILENMNKYTAGVKFEVMIILNKDEIKASGDYKILLKRNRWFRKIFGKKPFGDTGDYKSLSRKYSFIRKIFFRDNQGFDIGAYNYGYQYLKETGYEGNVVFMNSGVEGPSHNGWLLKYKNLFYKRSNTGLCGVSVNSHNDSIPTRPFMPHVQSFFLYTNMKILSEVFKEDLSGANEKDKLKLIEKGEIGISQRILDAGYGISCIAFPDFFYTKKSSWNLATGDLRYGQDLKEFINRI